MLIKQVAWGQKCLDRGPQNPPGTSGSGAEVDTRSLTNQVDAQLAVSLPNPNTA